MTRLLIFLSIAFLSFSLVASERKFQCQFHENVWFSDNWQKLYIEIILVPEEDDPFHWGVWGLERGTHIFEVEFFTSERKFIHSEDCPCSRQSYNPSQ